jgi:hypothetical protein
MKRATGFLAFLVLLLLPSAPPALAQSMPQPQTQGDATFISGGVGDDSQQAMLAAKKDYNLYLLFAQAVTGGYFADVPVKIYDAAGGTVVNAISAGPFFYARLKPGHYKVTAIHKGQSMTKTANVPAKGAADLYFYWPAS